MDTDKHIEDMLKKHRYQKHWVSLSLEIDEETLSDLIEKEQIFIIAAIKEDRKLKIEKTQKMFEIIESRLQGRPLTLAHIKQVIFELRDKI